MKKILRILCLFLCLPLAALAQEQDDKGRLARFLEDSLSSAGRTVTIDGFTGALSSVANVEKISIADTKGVWLRLEGVALDWNRAALFKGRLEVNSLTAKAITLTRKPVAEPTPIAPEATPFSLPELPVSVEIGTLKADKIRIHQDVLGSALTAKLNGQVSLADGQGRINLSLNRTDLVAGAFLLNAGFDNTTRRLTVALTATEAANGFVASVLNIPDRPSISLTVLGDAPLEAFRADLALATGGQERIAGYFESTTEPKTETVSAQTTQVLNIAGDLTPLVEARLHPFFGSESTLRAKLRKDDEGRLNLDDLALSTAALRASGNAVIAPSNLPEKFALDIAMGPTTGETLLLPAASDLSLGAAELRARYDAAKSDTWTLDGTISRFSHPEITAARVTIRGSGRIRADEPSLFNGAVDLVADGLRPTSPERADVARALGPNATIDLAWTWRTGAPLDLSRLRMTTRSGTLDATASVSGPLTGPKVTTRATAQLTDLAVLAPMAGRPLRGTLDATLAGSVEPLSGMFDLTIDTQSKNLRTGTAEIDALTSGGASRLKAKLRRDLAGLSWDEATLTAPGLSAASDGILTNDGGTVALDATLPALSRLFPSLSGSARLSAKATGADDLWTLDLETTGPGGAQIITRGTTTPDLSRLDLTAAGTAPLALVNGFTNAARADGLARIDLALRGPLALSSLSGTVDVQNARLSVAEPQLALEDIATTLRIANSTATVASNGRFALGGTFNVEGRADLATPNNADLTVGINRARIRYERLVETVLDGSIRIEGPLTGGALVSGQIALDDTEIRVDSVGNASVALPEITHLNTPAGVRLTQQFAGALASGRASSGPVYQLDVGVSAPTRIFLRGRGLDAEFGGALRVRGDTRKPVTSGNFDLLRGRMSFLAKRFDLAEGVIRLQGGPIPYMRLVATTQTADASFDVRLEGSADAPAFSITSDPDMPQDEALARLLFGETLSDISPLQAARLAAAVATLSGNGSGFNPLGSLREGAGIDDLDLKSDAEGNTSVTAGKYISDNVYTEIEVGNSGKSAISLNLDISPNLTVTGKADSEANSGLGLFFQKDY